MISLLLDIYTKPHKKNDADKPRKNRLSKFSFTLNDKYRAHSYLIDSIGIISYLNLLTRRIFCPTRLLAFLSEKRSVRALNSDLDKLSHDSLPANPYIYYPLHYEPELSSCPLGYPFSSSLDVLDQLAYACSLTNLRL